MKMSEKTGRGLLAELLCYVMEDVKTQKFPKYRMRAEHLIVQELIRRLGEQASEQKIEEIIGG